MNTSLQRKRIYSACLCRECPVCLNKFSSSFLLVCDFLRLFIVISPVQIFIAQKSMQYTTITFQCTVLNVRGTGRLLKHYNWMKNTARSWCSGASLCFQVSILLTQMSSNPFCKRCTYTLVATNVVKRNSIVSVFYFI